MIGDVMIFDYQDMNIYYEVYGNKDKVILILPGWGQTRKTFHDMIKILKLEYTVYILDYPGFGHSPFPNRDLILDDYVQMVTAFIERNNLENVNIIAHSFGGRIAILLANQPIKKKIHKLILIDSAGIKPKKTIKKWFRQKLYKCLQSMADILPKKIRKKAKYRLFQHFASNDYQNLPSNERTTFKNIISTDLTDKLATITINTLLIWGAKDEDTPLKDGIKMQKKIANSQLIIFPRSTHFCYLENPYVIVRIILYFLED